MSSRLVAVAPATRPEMHKAMCRAVTAGGAILADPQEAEALVWADPHQAELFREIIASNPEIQWVQLPYAGIETFLEHLDEHRTWTNAKGVYAAAVAETVLAHILALCKNLHGYARATRWERPVGQMLRGSRITILGGGGIARHLLALLIPFNCDVTIVRRTGQPLNGASRTIAAAGFPEVLPETDVLVLALPLTPETEGIVGTPELTALPNHALLINVARGRHVVTEAVVEALRTGSIGGAALDVTSPEPLPDDHPLWHEPTCLITPHIGNTPEMGLKLLEPFVMENVRRFCSGEDLLAQIDISVGY